MKTSLYGDMPRRESLFWDVNPAGLDPQKNAQYIIERILDFGHDDEVRWMWHNYSRDRVRKVVETSRVLHRQTRTLWTALTQQ